MQHKTQPGDLWHLGDSTLACGDCTDPATIHAATGGALADLVIADPPYGMRKKFKNDNLRGAALVEFIANAWRVWLASLSPRASAFIFGNPDTLWRLWLTRFDGEGYTFKNEVVWLKGKPAGRGNPTLTRFKTETERALFFVRGVYDPPRANDTFWPGHEPLRMYLSEQVTLAGWSLSDLNRITGNSTMASHWLSTHQFSTITEKNYTALQKAAPPGCFLLSYAQLRALATERPQESPEYLAYRASLPFFDPSQKPQTDVWHFPRPCGPERFGHDTPKPVDLYGHMMRAACPPGGLVLDPFGGTGPALIAAHDTGRRCAAVELSPGYCDKIVSRWEAHTGQRAELVRAANPDSPPLPASALSLATTRPANPPTLPLAAQL